jgi:hypothetical protein
MDRYRDMARTLELAGGDVRALCVCSIRDDNQAATFAASWPGIISSHHLPMHSGAHGAMYVM